MSAPEEYLIGCRRIFVGPNDLPADFVKLIERFIESWVADFGRVECTDVCDVTAIPIDDAAEHWRLVHHRTGCSVEPPATVSLATLTADYRTVREARLVAERCGVRTH